MNGNIAQFSLSFPFLLWYNAHKATPQHMHGPAGHQRGLPYSRLGGIVSWKIIVPAASCWPVSSLPGPYGIGSLGGPAGGSWIFSPRLGSTTGRSCPLSHRGTAPPPICPPPLLPATPISSTWMNWRPRGSSPLRSWTGPAGPTRTGWITTIWPRPVSPCCGRPGNAPKPPTSSLTPQTCPGWRITAPSPPSTTGIKPLSGSGLRTPLRRSRRRLIFTVSSRRPSTASGWL